MNIYDVVVIGAGDVGLGVAFRAASADLKVALVDKGRLGGTCVNYGCVPSKTLLCTADRIMEMRNNSKLGISSQIDHIDFSKVMKRMRGIVASGRNSIKKAVEDSGEIHFIGKEAHFLDEHTLAVGNKKISGRKIFIATGARPSLPQVRGLETVPFLTNESILDLKKKPASILFAGGGYIALEFAHFFSALGVKVTVIDRNKTLLHFAEPEISELLKKELERRVKLYLGVEIVEVKNIAGGCAVRVKNIGTGREHELSSELLMISAGRKSNADLLKPEHAGIETDNANFIKVDETLRTNKKHIWAVGDAIGKAMFTHAGDREAEIVWHNATHRNKLRMDFGLVPFAVYTWPQIASVGLTERQARMGRDVLVGRALYSDTVMGEAMGEAEGFAKAIVEKRTGQILGFHIAGPHAAVLIQEVVNAMVDKRDVHSITEAMHIFPALSNLVPETFGNLA